MDDHSYGDFGRVLTGASYKNGDLHIYVSIETKSEPLSSIRCTIQFKFNVLYKGFIPVPY